MHKHSSDELQNGVLNELDSIPRDREGPVFNEPWEAEVFAIAISLHAQGLFTWKEWASALGKTISEGIAHGDPDLGDTYYLHWLKTLEHMIVHKEIGNQSTLSELQAAWNDAAISTPHGQAIVLPVQARDEP